MSVKSMGVIQLRNSYLHGQKEGLHMQNWDSTVNPLIKQDGRWWLCWWCKKDLIAARNKFIQKFLRSPKERER